MNDYGKLNIGLTSFQEISGNGERCKSVKHAEPGNAAGDLTEGLCERRRKRVPSPLFKIKLKKKNNFILQSDTNCWIRCIDHHYYYSAYFLSTFVLTKF